MNAQTTLTSMEPQRFLLMAAHLIHRALVEPSRTECKQCYRALEDGKVTPLARVEMEDKSQAHFTLALEHSEFRGRLNFGAFSASVKLLLANIAKAIEEDKPLRIFGAQDGSAEGAQGGAMIFGVTAVTVEDNTPNVMVLAADPSDADQTRLQLMYLDPAQFVSQPAQEQDA